MLKADNTKSVNDLLIGQQCFFCVNRDWVFDCKLSDKSPPWSVINQVYFRNGRQHKTLSFSLPYVVAELSLESVLLNTTYVRMIIIYGDNINSMMGSANHLMARESGTTLHIEKLSEPCDISTLETIFNRVLKTHYQFQQLKFFNYEDGFHHTLSGQWHERALNGPTPNPAFFRPDA